VTMEIVQQHISDSSHVTSLSKNFSVLLRKGGLCEAQVDVPGSF
jgi:hypothetical protein